MNIPSIKNVKTLKFVSYRMISFLLIFFLSLLITHNPRLSLFFGLIDLMIKPILFFFHDKVLFTWINSKQKVEKDNPKQNETIISIDKKVLNYTSNR